MFRRGIYISELIPLLLSLGMLGAAVYGLATERVVSVGNGVGDGKVIGLVSHAQDPGLFWMSIALYLVMGVVLGFVSLRNLRGY
jgi:hypothetical protein